MVDIQLDLAGMLGAKVVEISYAAEQLTVWNDAYGVTHVAGEIDSFSAPSLRAALVPFYASTLPLVLNLSAVTFFGSAGVSELIHLHERLNGRLEIDAISSAIRRALTASGLLTFFDSPVETRRAS